MRILFEGRCRANYLAKCHEAFRTGLMRVLGARMYGPGYPGHDEALHDYTGIVNRVFLGSMPDVLIAEFSEAANADKGFRYSGLSAVNTAKVTWLCDYWNATENYRQEFLDILSENGVGMVMSYFPQPIRIYAGTSYGNRIAYLPPCYDPDIFNDWHVPKIYDVGFLAAGTTEVLEVYPERRAIHQRLLAEKGLRYLWAGHPGWAEQRDHPLVGRGFSEKINSCRLFVTTSGLYRNPQPKYVEIMASRSVLMADEPEGAERLYLKDGYNYIKISPDTIVDKIQFMLARPDLCDAVAEAGYLTALKHHTCYQRAVDFYVDARRILFGLPPEKEPVPPRSIIDGLRQALSLGKGKRRR